MFFFLRNSSPLFSITRSSSFSVIHVSVNIKNNAEKDTTLLLFFLSKSLGGHVISFQIKPWVAFGLPVVRTDGRAGGRAVGRSFGQCTVTWLPNFLGWVDYHVSSAILWGSVHARRVELHYKTWRSYPIEIKVSIYFHFCIQRSVSTEFWTRTSCLYWYCY